MPDKPERIYLSAPHATQEDIDAVVRAMKSGWLAPVGPDLTAFEEEVAAFVGVKHAVALSSGTAALHLALKYVGVQPGDRVIVPTLTFAATAFPVTYLGAEPVFVDVDESWNMDPGLLQEAIRQERKAGHRVTAAIPVDLYGTPADYDEITQILDDEGIPLIEDAAEGLGARHNRGMVGSFGQAAALSFNGNKIMTTSGGGMLVTNDANLADKVRYWATQSREPVHWYEHTEVGFNYRMSNVLAALGRSQLTRLPSEVERRRQLRNFYRDQLADIDGVTVQDDPPWGSSNAWLSVITMDHTLYAVNSNAIREALDADGLESRLVWKPLHLQPVFGNAHAHLTGASERLFVDSICIPSGSNVDYELVNRIAAIVRKSISHHS